MNLSTNASGFTLGVDAVVRTLQQNAVEIEKSLDEMYEKCANIGRGGNGYAELKSRIRVLLAQHAILVQASTAVTSMQPDTELPMFVPRFVPSPEVETPEVVVVEKPARKPTFTGIHLKLD